jgi:hypothetical protein
MLQPGKIGFHICPSMDSTLFPSMGILAWRNPRRNRKHPRNFHQISERYNEGSLYFLCVHVFLHEYLKERFKSVAFFSLFFLRKCCLNFHVHCWAVFRHMVFVDGFLFSVKELGLLTNPGHWVRVLDVVGSYMYIVL